MHLRRGLVYILALCLSLACPLSLSLALSLSRSLPRFFSPCVSHTLSCYCSLSLSLAISLSPSNSLSLTIPLPGPHPRGESRCSAVMSEISEQNSTYIDWSWSFRHSGMVYTLSLALFFCLFLSFSLARSLSFSLANFPILSPHHHPSLSLSLSLARLGWTSALSVDACDMGWLRLVVYLKLQVSFAKEPYKRDYILQKRHIILS